MTLQNNKLKKIHYKVVEEQKINKLKTDPYCVSGKLLCHTALNLGPSSRGPGGWITNLQTLLDFITTSTGTKYTLLSKRPFHHPGLRAAFLKQGLV